MSVYCVTFKVDATLLMCSERSYSITVTNHASCIVLAWDNGKLVSDQITISFIEFSRICYIFYEWQLKHEHQIILSRNKFVYLDSRKICLENDSSIIA